MTIVSISFSDIALTYLFHENYEDRTNALINVYVMPSNILNCAIKWERNVIQWEF